MAAYITRDELLDLTIPGDAFAGLTNDQIDSCIFLASGEADSFVGKRYSLPLIAPYDSSLKAKVADITAYRCAKKRGFRPGSGNNEVIVDAYKGALDWLLDLSKGNVVLQGLDSTPDVDEEGSLSISSQPKNNWSVTTGRRDCDD